MNSRPHRVLRLALGLVLLTAPAAFGRDRAGGDGGLQVRHPHPFNRDQARVRVEQLLEYWSGRFGVIHRWEGDRVWVKGRFWGMQFDGVLVVEDDEVRAVANDPGTLLRQQGLNYVSGKLRKYLHPTYEG